MAIISNPISVAWGKVGTNEAFVRLCHHRYSAASALLLPRLGNANTKHAGSSAENTMITVEGSY